MIGFAVRYGRVHESERLSGNRLFRFHVFLRRTVSALSVHKKAAQTTRDVM